MKRLKLFVTLGLLFLFIFTLASCDKLGNSTNANPAPGNAVIPGETGSTEDVTPTEAEDVEEEAPVVTTNNLNIEVVSNADLGVGSFEQNGNIYTITAAGKYDISGELSEGSIVIDAAEDAEVLINLNGVNITSTQTSPINVISAGKVEISAKKDTTNYITDSRTSASDEDPTAAIYSNCDLKIKGNGSLYVFGNYNNGIHSKDDLEIKNLNLQVTALNNALKGNDSVTIDSLNATIISTGGDGIKTTNSDISSKGNQRGIITITGNASLDIYACCDGIDAAYNVEILKDAEGLEPTINIYTSSYSSYSNDSPSSISTSNVLYLKLASGYYSTSYDYYAYCYDTANKENGDWIKLAYYQSASSNMGFGGRNSSTYYYLKANVDTSKYSGVQIYMFEANSSTSLTDYFAASTGQAINSTKDMLTVTSISTSTKKIGVDWSSYSSTSSQSMGPGGFGGMDQGNTDKTSYSTKGIKADNEVIISAGAITIKAYDDGIHATSNVTLENGSTSLGNVTINGGTIMITSKDDGIHADAKALIADGSVNVLTAYEGVEGNIVEIDGGNNNIYATDDGINASSQIIIKGGNNIILVASGDTDAIDSNGTYTQTGGVVVSMNLSNQGMATALDTDGKATISGGVFVGFGNMETTPTVSNVKSATKSISLSAGSYELKYNDQVLLTFTLKNSYSKFYIAGASGSYNIGNNSISL